jgi:hypothetical protein
MSFRPGDIVMFWRDETVVGIVTRVERYLVWGHWIFHHPLHPYHQKFMASSDQLKWIGRIEGGLEVGEN